MAKLTRDGIAYDLTTSPYVHTITYSVKDKITFVFSSEYYRTNFIKKYEDNRRAINESLSNRFGFTIKHNVLSDLKLYTKIEKRGFLIFCNGVSVECPDNIILDGNNLIMMS